MGETRNTAIRVRLTEREKEEIARKAHEYGISMSRFVREAALGNVLERVVYLVDPALLSAISRIGNNVNQIARRLNALHLAGRLTRIEMLDCFDVLESIEKSLRKLSQP